MILRTHAVRMYFVTQPTNLRQSFEGLTKQIRHVLGYDPLSIHVFVLGWLTIPEPPLPRCCRATGLPPLTRAIGADSVPPTRQGRGPRSGYWSSRA